jgi:hypothetical protein
VGDRGDNPPPTFGVGDIVSYIPQHFKKKMFRRPRSGVSWGENWRKGVKKGRQLRRCLTERSTDVSFPEKGRQIFVCPQSVPPTSETSLRHSGFEL